MTECSHVYKSSGAKSTSSFWSGISGCLARMVDCMMERRAVVATSALVPVAASVKKAALRPVDSKPMLVRRMGVMRRLTLLQRTGARPARAVVAEVKVGMPRRVSARVPVAGAVRGVTGAASGWGSVGCGGGAAVVLR